MFSEKPKNVRTVTTLAVIVVIFMRARDTIIAINGARITSIDDISAYLEEYSLPGETINITIIRDNQTDNVVLELESRPAATTAT